MIDEDIEAYLARGEALFADLRADARKQVVWADPAARARTPVVIVYIHGFSASAGEVRPLPDLVAKVLGANLFFTRLAGHGRGSDAMAEATVSGWLKDFDEATDIAGRLGERIVVIATSTGATLTTVALGRRDTRSGIAAIVFLSPNFLLKSPGAFLLTLPGIGRLLPHLIGRRRGFTPRNEAHGLLWTTSYPVEALLPMAELVKRAGRTRVEDIAVPALFVRSPQDKIVDAGATDRIAARWGGPHDVIDPGAVGDIDHHVIAGDALSPETTVPLAGGIVGWLRQALDLR